MVLRLSGPEERAGCHAFAGPVRGPATAENHRESMPALGGRHAFAVVAHGILSPALGGGMLSRWFLHGMRSLGRRRESMAPAGHPPRSLRSGRAGTAGTCRP